MGQSAIPLLQLLFHCSVLSWTQLAPQTVCLSGMDFEHLYTSTAHIYIKGTSPASSLLQGHNISLIMRSYFILIAISIWLDVGLATEDKGKDKDPGIGITLYDGYA
jgi:hypothetical protein